MHSDNSLIRHNLRYNLPLGIKGSSYIELYPENGYYGKTSLEKELVRVVSFKLQAKHPNTLLYSVGLGVSGQVSTPNGTSLKLSIMPVWIDKNGKQNNRSYLSYYSRFKFPLRFKIDSFGEWNIASENGINWTYGELFLNKSISKSIDVGYNPRLVSDGDAMPMVEQGVGFRVNF
ncbi:hypothetical protein HYT23_02435 [Candidatus Pacearchaeota archaeon]|nr:hypothetical protein [Candidatus Pacearchaeota archaeon]